MEKGKYNILNFKLYYIIQGMSMKCPVCKDVTLLMSEKRGVEIDYCPECRGIWLDRGELEKLIEKEEAYNKEHYEYKHENKKYDDKYEERKHYHDDDYDDKYYKDSKYPRRRKRESFMGEIFDIFGGD